MSRRLDNSGQTLILFLFLLPVLFIVCMAVYQLGTMQLEKRKIIGSVEKAMKYGFNNMDDEQVIDKMKDLIITETPTLLKEDIQIEVEDAVFTISIMKEYKIVFVMTNKLELKYTGQMNNNKLEIKEDRG